MALTENQVHSIALHNKIVLITGGYGYLGKGIVDSLLHHGASVYVLGRSHEKYQNSFPAGTYDKYPLEFQTCDVASKNSVDEAFKNIYAIEGRIDCLINNAFFLKGQNPEGMSDDDFLYGLHGTLGTVYTCIREILPYFKNQRRGKIINLSSMYGLVAPNFDVYSKSPEYLNPPHYGAAKAGVVQLTKYFASYSGKWGINVNAVAPGPFPSEKVQKNTKFIEELKNSTVLDRIGSPKDLGGIFTFLCSDSSDYITGQCLIVDGGWTIK